MSLLLNDTFTGSSGTNLASHSPDTGGAWHKIGSDNFVLDGSGKLYAASTNPFYYNDTTPANADYSVSVDLTLNTVNGGCYPVVWARMDAAGNNGYLFYMYYDTGGVHILKLVKLVSGAQTELGSDAAAWATAGSPSTFTLTLSCTGTSIVAKINGTTVFSITDSSLASVGYAGISTYVSSGADQTASTGVSFDNVQLNGTAGGGGGSAKLFLPNPMNGIGSGGPFFANPLS